MFNALEAMIKIANELGIYLEGRTGHDKVLRKRHKRRKDGNMNKALSSVDYRLSHLEADVKKKDPNGNITYVRFKYFKKPDGNWYKQRADGQGVIRPCSKSEVPLNMATKVGTVDGMTLHHGKDRVPLRITSRSMSKHDEQHESNASPSPARAGEYVLTSIHNGCKEIIKPKHISIQRNYIREPGGAFAINHEIGHHIDMMSQNNKANTSHIHNSNSSEFKQILGNAARNLSKDALIKPHDLKDTELYADFTASRKLGKSSLHKVTRSNNLADLNSANNHYQQEFKKIKDNIKRIKNSSMSKTTKREKIDKCLKRRHDIVNERDTEYNRYKAANKTRRDIGINLLNISKK